MNDKFIAVVTVDAAIWGSRTKADLVSDWIEPLVHHPKIEEVIFVGDVSTIAQCGSFAQCKYVAEGNERQVILDAGSRPGIAGVLRLRHQIRLRFPLTARLIDETIQGYAEKTPRGYYQMDLTDLPYPYLLTEILGRDAIRSFINNPQLPIDWNTVKIINTDQYPMERGELSYAARCEYLENPLVEYFTFPKFIALESSRLCNLRCTMCVTHSDFIDHSHLEKYPKHFSLEKYQWILDQMVPYKAHMSIAPQFQGEPFMAPHIKEMIVYAKKKGFFVGFTSNATMWNEEIIEFLIAQEVNSLCVSLDGATKESYEQVRIGAKFDHVVKNLNRLLTRKAELGVSSPALAINMTLMPENRHEEEKMLSDWLGKVTLVSINNTCTNHVVPEKFHEPDRYPCPFLWEGMHILTNGDVIACCRDSKYEEVMGNAYDTPIMEIWNNEKYRRFRKLHVLKRWDEIPMCAHCDTWMCKTKKTVGDGDRMYFQYPFYRQYYRSSVQLNERGVSPLESLWSAANNTVKSMATTLINLTPLGRKAS